MASNPSAAASTSDNHDDDDDDDDDSGGDDDGAQAQAEAAAQHDRLRMLLHLRRQEALLVNLLELAHAQEVAIQERQRAEEDEFEMALARSLEESLLGGGGGGGGGGSDHHPAHSLRGAPAGPSIRAVEAALPAMPFSEASGFLVTRDDGGAHECAICLADLKAKDQVRLLPCMHVFHQDCVDKWLTRAGTADPTCPTCKQQIPVG